MLPYIYITLKSLTLKIVYITGKIEKYNNIYYFYSNNECIVIVKQDNSVLHIPENLILMILIEIP